MCAPAFLCSPSIIRTTAPDAAPTPNRSPCSLAPAVFAVLLYAHLSCSTRAGEVDDEYHYGRDYDLIIERDDNDRQVRCSQVDPVRGANKIGQGSKENILNLQIWDAEDPASCRGIF